MIDAPADAPQILSPAEAATLAAIASRLIPADEAGPGADEAGVVTFVDRALGSFYAAAREAYRVGLAALERLAQDAYGQPFARLGPADQDALLARLERGEAAGFEPAGSAAFFNLVRKHVVEGFFADPVYGGNRDFVGWRLVGFPGAVGSYTPAERASGRPLDRPFVSVADWLATLPAEDSAGDAR